jgi:hypothetical protein
MGIQFGPNNDLFWSYYLYFYRESLGKNTYPSQKYGLQSLRMTPIWFEAYNSASYAEQK